MTNNAAQMSRTERLAQTVELARSPMVVNYAAAYTDGYNVGYSDGLRSEVRSHRRPRRQLVKHGAAWPVFAGMAVMCFLFVVSTYVVSHLP